MAVKVILDTDIGTDVDDAWALALCLASPGIDLIGLTLVHADLTTRARIALKMLKLAGRADVPVYHGLSDTLTDGGRHYWAGHEGTDTDFSDIEGLSAREGAVDFILETVDRYPGEVVLCPVGPFTNAAAAISRSPETMRKVKRLAIMGSTYQGDGPGNASPEHNACVDPAATKIVFESGLPATIVGLNVTTQVCVRTQDMESVSGNRFGNYLSAMTRQYFGVRKSEYTHMHDPLAIATLTDPDIVTTRTMTAEVLSDGRVVWTPSASGGMDVCTDVDAKSFEKLLLSRVASIACKGE